MADKRAFDPIGGRYAPPIGEQQVCISIPVALIPHLLGVIEPLKWPDVWSGDPQLVNEVTGTVENLLARLVSRTRCDIPDCPDCPDCPEYPPQTGSYAPVAGNPSELEETDVGQVVTDVQIIDGTIRVFFGPCCYKDLGSIQDILESGTEADIEPPWDEGFDGEPPVYSACSKAYSIVKAVYRLVEIAFTQVDNAPWQYVGNIEKDFGYDLDNNHVYDLMGAVMFLYLSVPGTSYGDTFDSDQQARIINHVAALMQSDSTGVPTSALFEQIKAQFSFEMTFENYAGIYWRALDAIGRHDLDTIAKAGALENTSYNCDAPEGLLFDGVGMDFDWRYIWDFRNGQQGWTLGTNTHVDTTYGLWGDSMNGISNRCPIEAYINFDQINNGSSLMMAGVLVEFLGDDNMDNNFVYFGHNNLTLVGPDQIAERTGDAPCTPGKFEIVRYGYDLMTTVDTRFRAYLYAYHEDTVEHPDVVASSQRVVAVIFAGNGPGPLATPPVYPPP